MKHQPARRIIAGLGMIVAGTFGAAVHPAAASAAGDVTVCALSQDGLTVVRYQGGSQWRDLPQNIPGGIRHIYGGGYGLFATSNWSTGGIYRHIGTGWVQIGGPGTTFLVTDTALYGITLDHSAIKKYSGVGSDWLTVGPAADNLYGGRDGVFSTDPVTGDIRSYVAPGEWQRIGSGGATFAVTDTALYGITPSHSAIMKYSGTGTDWTQVGTEAADLYGGGYGLFATQGNDRDIYRYTDSGPEKIGGPGASFLVTRDGLFGITPSHKAVAQYDGRPFGWHSIGGPQGELTSCPTAD
jgi:hypothetical protein